MNHSNIIFKLMCYKHSKDFEFYCATCQEHLCEQCVNKGEHNEHVVTKIEAIDLRKKEKKKVKLNRSTIVI